jgi:electron transfer flavoprotein alpha subunit
VTQLSNEGGPTAVRWYYRQRIEAKLRRKERPWVLLVDPGAMPALAPEGGAAPPVETVEVAAPAARTKVAGVRAPSSGEQTIRPDAKLLFVAGAGWTKKQPDGKPHPEKAEELIIGFLRASGASLGSSKSLVDQAGEGQKVFEFMTHLNQVGQTGATPRHPKGLSTCCHGEEPHVVGWRFIRERRAVNLDANCGWARGKADVLYVADAFQVMEKVNALLAAKK